MKFLLVEDNPDHVELIRDAFDGAFEKDIDLLCIDKLKDIERTLEQQDIDLLICDLSLPDSTIPNTVAALKQFSKNIPVIVLTSLDDFELARLLVAAGVQDYLPKGDLHPALLQRICSYAIERKKTDLLLERRNADYQTFCYSLSHDFKAALRRIAGFSKMLSDDQTLVDKLSTDQVECLDLIAINASRILRITNDLYDYFALDFGEDSDSPLAIDELVNSGLIELQSLIKSKGAEISIAECPKVAGNATQLQLLFQNLIGNAIKYNNNTPKINISLHQQQRHLVCVAVKDNGIGVSADQLDKIFTPFYRSRRDVDSDGSGLGLSIVRRIVDKHGGKIWAESAPGSGSTFYVSLRRA